MDTSFYMVSLMVSKSKLKKTIPSKMGNFQKLQQGRNPSEFIKWANDQNGDECLYYWVDGNVRDNKKRIPIEEIKKSVDYYQRNGEFLREDFERLCPIADSAGGCGYTVIGRIIEHIKGAKYKGIGNGFKIIFNSISFS